MSTFTILYTPRCILRPISLDEMPIIRYIVDDKLFKSFLPELYEQVKSEEGLCQFIHYFNTCDKNDDRLLWGIETGGILTGFVAIMDISYAPVLFYAMHPRYRNQGYAKESVLRVVRCFKERYSNITLQTEVYEDNYASISILLSCGFIIIREKDGKSLLTFTSTIFNG